MNFVAAKDPTDTRLLDFICEPAGFVAMPKLTGKHSETVRAILMMAVDLTKGDGK